MSSPNNCRARLSGQSPHAHYSLVFLSTAFLVFALVEIAAGRSNAIVDARKACEDGNIVAGIELLLDSDLLKKIEFAATADSLEAQLVLADCQILLGQTEESRQTLLQGSQRAQRAFLPEYEITFLHRLSDSNLSAGDAMAAIGNIDRALQLVPTNDPQDLRPMLLLALGNAYVMNDQPDDAESRFREAAAAAVKSDAFEISIDATLNLSRTLIELQRGDEALRRLEDSRFALAKLPDNAWKASRLAAMGELLHLADTQLDSVDRAGAAIDALQGAATIARSVKDARVESTALGHLGSMAERFGEWEKAQDYTRAAILLAQQAEALDRLYQWQWQAARIHENQGQEDLAIAYYRQAIDTLEGIRPQLSRGSTQTFNQAFAPLFFGLANLLLDQNAVAEDILQAQASLRQVQDTIERFKVAEIQDYFDDQCVVEQEQQARVELLASGVAIVYPIIFDDRLEVLTSISGRIHRHTAPVNRRDLTKTVRDFRRGLVRRPTHRYRKPGRELFTWLVEPMLTELRASSIDTLIFVPDGPLRTVPPAALYDGSHFLIEEFAVSTSLGLTLTSPRPIERESVKVLAGGLTLPVDGFPPLPGVATELDEISTLFATTELRNQAFRVAPLFTELSEGGYSIVHIATHGQFKADYRQSFLLTYDGRMTMDQLENTVGMRRYLNEPVELLMLSACETAVGDDRAALGLAGIALKAGARSAVASLWSISDEATAIIVRNFYTQLKDPAITKAQALRFAQVNALNDRRYAHPAVWSAYLLIGNWL
jgi:CHAT domain-containing protein